MWRNKDVRAQWLAFAVLTAVLAAMAAVLDWRCALLVLWGGVGYGAVQYYFLWRRYDALAALCREIDRVLHGAQRQLLSGNEEGELAILRSEIGKMTVRLQDAAAQQLENSRRLSAAMADISHQLRTPLTAMNLTATLLSAETLSDERRAQLTGQLRSLLSRVDWLVEALLKMSRIDAGAVTFTRESLPVRRLIDSAAAPLAVPMDIRGQELRILCGEERLLGDLGWSTEALGNVLKNCMEHTPEGGTITVTAQETPLFTQITVRDEGQGVAAEDLPHLFQRFYKGKNAAEGSFGIGLALSRMILSGQNGTIRAENAPEGGALFTLRWYKGTV